MLYFVYNSLVNRYIKAPLAPSFPILLKQLSQQANRDLLTFPK